MPVRPIQIICLPYAGGNRLSYKLYNSFVPDHVTLHTIDYPGHGARLKETPLLNLHDIAKDAYQQIQHLLQAPYVIYGHSMGARVGYLLTREIQLQQRPLPEQLFFSGSEAPIIPSPHSGKHLLSQRDFFKALHDMGGMPKEVLQQQDLLAFFEPVLRADFKAVSDYRHQPSLLLDLPITVMAGTEEAVSPADLLPWQQETQQAVEIHFFDGGHFFINSHAATVVQTILSKLDMSMQ